jgi:hypothetical protein
MTLSGIKRDEGRIALFTELLFLLEETQGLSHIFFIHRCIKEYCDECHKKIVEFRLPFGGEDNETVLL